MSGSGIERIRKFSNAGSSGLKPSRLRRPARIHYTRSASAIVSGISLLDQRLLQLRISHHAGCNKVPGPFMQLANFPGDEHEQKNTF
jgi:hypothetical protein